VDLDFFFEANRTGIRMDIASQVTNIWVSPYELIPKVAGSLNAKTKVQVVHGVLLRVQFHDQKVFGHASLQSWPTLGDPSIEALLARVKSLHSGDVHDLLQCSLQSALLDAEFRGNERNAFSGLVVPASHATLTELSEQAVQQAREAGFSAVKCKIGRDLLVEGPHLEQIVRSFPDIRLRLDANDSVTSEFFLKWWLSLSDELKDAVDFVEDAFVGAANTELRRFPIALDRDLHASAQGQVDYGVWKPALLPRGQVGSLIDKGKFDRWVVTSYMDHPIGQSFSAYEAALLAQKCSSEVSTGLQTQACFEPTAYSDCLGEWSPHWSPASGYGWGFDRLLENEPWKLIYQSE